MSHIPVEFDYNGSHYKGYLSQPFGSGGNVWHLMVGKFYWGQLLYSETYGWKFYNNEKRYDPGQGSMQELADYFGEIVMLWDE